MSIITIIIRDKNIEFCISQATVLKLSSITLVELPDRIKDTKLNLSF